MKLQLVKYTCGSCGSVFDAPALTEGAYGEFLLWSREGRMRYLNAFVDPTLKEVDNLLRDCKALEGSSPLERSKFLHRLYGRVACDPDVQGAPFDIDAYPPCPSCHSSKVISWEFKDPPEFVDVDVPIVTHHIWSSLLDGQKEELLCTELGKH